MLNYVVPVDVDSMFSAYVFYLVYGVWRMCVVCVIVICVSLHGYSGWKEGRRVLFLYEHTTF